MVSNDYYVEARPVSKAAKLAEQTAKYANQELSQEARPVSKSALRAERQQTLGLVERLRLKFGRHS